LKGEKPSAKFCLLDNKEKGFCIITGDEKWIYFDCKRRKIICDPANPQHRRKSGIPSGKKVMLSIWWDQKDIMYHELKSDQTVTGDLYRKQLSV